MVGMPSTDLQGVFQETPDTLELEIKCRRLELANKIQKQKTLELEQQIAKKDEIDTIRRNSLEEKNSDLQRQFEELQKELKTECRRLELDKKIKKQNTLELEQQIAKKDEINAISRNSLEEKNSDLQRQVEELQKKVSEKVSTNEDDVEMADVEESNTSRRDCDIRCDACDHSMDTQDEMAEHIGICHCNPNSQMYNGQTP